MPYGKLITRFTTGGHDIFHHLSRKKYAPRALRALGVGRRALGACFLGTGDGKYHTHLSFSG